MVIENKYQFEDRNLECFELDKQLGAPAGEAGDLVQTKPELRAGIPEAGDILGQVPEEIIRGVIELASLLEDDPMALLELKEARCVRCFLTIA